ncbi:leukocyte receptor cluster member 1 [Dorcoceras hygrometricum]|uniref:Leukocyte receptor cluster member 1 n=1 Tax=Dorcoceras hygrometricum TaxID=472368 RepID=A0A2Z7CKL1_9LAMI|nr:leukocyte receptor cluster member 1 [Dorcoceras hygrometricum]
MGGHGGLNILPQKRWNVYNYENREKVRRDEEAAAREEQLKREQSRKRDAELRLEKLRQARGLSSSSDQVDRDKPASTPTAIPAEVPQETESDSRHINLFEGIRIFDPIQAGEGKREVKKGKFWRDTDNSSNKKAKKNEEPRVVGPEDEKYRMGYGVAGKGVKLPWYMEKRASDDKNLDDEEDFEDESKSNGNKKSNVGKKSLQELREERLKRERMEKEREKALIREKSRRDGGFSSRKR